MRNAIAILAIGAMCLLGGGCKSSSHHETHTKSTAASASPSTTAPAGMQQPMMMSADACSHCPGAQTATQAGTCSKCGMRVGKLH